jgi:hypothetical protein
MNLLMRLLMNLLMHFLIHLLMHLLMYLLMNLLMHLLMHLLMILLMHLLMILLMHLLMILLMTLLNLERAAVVSRDQVRYTNPRQRSAMPFRPVTTGRPVLNNYSRLEERKMALKQSLKNRLSG